MFVGIRSTKSVLVVIGDGCEAGSELSRHMDVTKVSFTGSVKVGKLIQKASAETNFKKITLELGGKNPFIVFPDVDRKLPFTV